MVMVLLYYFHFSKSVKYGLEAEAGGQSRQETIICYSVF